MQRGRYFPTGSPRPLKAILVERPKEAEKFEAWEALPIFRQAERRKRKTDGDGAWTTSSYKKAWTAILEALAKQYPALRGMVPRDFRPLASTKMTDGRTPEPVIDRWMGHAPSVSRKYYQVTTKAMEEAAEALTRQRKPRALSGR
ncbi:MAG TPA: hypothetical protein VJ826_08930 [Candidatus Polarisedimenticolaceae bacterium]|nr:hypothetical protein [Candidatus Polarisedimenticolaceae bacterium]